MKQEARENERCQSSLFDKVRHCFYVSGSAIKQNGG